MTITKVIRRFFARLIINWSSSADVTGSSPADGSSRNSISGSRAIALARATLLIIPPLNSEGNLFSDPLSPTISSFIFAINFLISVVMLVNSSIGSIIFSKAVIDPNNAPLWYETPIFFKIPIFFSSSTSVISSPSIIICPLAGGYRPIICFSTVLLPQPEPPRMTNISPL